MKRILIALALVLIASFLCGQGIQFKVYPDSYSGTLSLKESTIVNLSIYNMKGQLIVTLINEYKNPGYHYFTWNGKDKTGRFVTNGIYFYKMTTGKFSATKKIILLK